MIDDNDKIKKALDKIFSIFPPENNNDFSTGTIT